MSELHPMDNGGVMISEKNIEDARELYNKMLDASKETILPLVNQYLTILNGGEKVAMAKMHGNHAASVMAVDTKAVILRMATCISVTAAWRKHDRTT